jgi:hypothetical protein
MKPTPVKNWGSFGGGFRAAKIPSPSAASGDGISSLNLTILQGSPLRVKKLSQRNDFHHCGLKNKIKP